MVDGVNEIQPHEDPVVGRPVRPGDGERRAIVGFHGQYNVAANVILNSLHQEGLEWVRVADPLAGRVDDFQIGSQGRVDAFQVKWSQYPGSFTFRDLTTGKDAAPNLMSQLAQGWLELKKQHHSCRIVVHLVTNEYPSTSLQTNMPTGSPPPTPSHFAAFLAQVWTPYRQSPPDTPFAVPDEWQLTWSAVREASGLDEMDFQAFVTDCHLEFSYQLPFNSELPKTMDQIVTHQDIEQIAHSLFGTVAHPARVIELTRLQLLTQLDWGQRFELVNPHQFPVDETLYQPIEETVHELIESIDQLAGGYIAVVGTPGSGKSTLLTKTLRDLKGRVFSYYAYVPDAAYPVGSRGESVNFLHDVGIQMEGAGFAVGSGPAGFDRQQLLNRFYGQLDLLKQDWEKEGHKTIILIDGLDHIEREQDPHQSLLGDLPNPEQIPDGVYFVLGTQTVAPLSGRIQSSLREQRRTISMKPLGRQQTQGMFDSADLRIPITMEQRDLAHDLSSGHPLYLAYLINKIRRMDDPEQIKEELQEGEVFDGNIEATYHTYWNQFRGDGELINFLGLLARIRGVLDFSWIRKWGRQSPLELLGSKFAHYFRIENPDRWYFFHNSFRSFLVKKTAEFPAGTIDPTKDRDFHIVLADLCGEKSAPPVRAWEEIYHRASAEQHVKVLEIATQAYFRNQLFSLRPLEAIKTDILVALRSAAARQDAIALARLCLIGSELHQRGFYLEQVDLVPLLLELQDPQITIDYLRTGSQLHVDASTALRACIILNNLGRQEESRRIFDLAKPFAPLTGSGIQTQRGTNDSASLLGDWAKAAVLFQSIGRLIQDIRHIQFTDGDFYRGDDGSAVLILQSRLLVYAGLELLSQQRWPDLDELLEAFDDSRPCDVQGRFWLNFNIYEDREMAGDHTKAKEHLNAMLSTDEQVLGPTELTVLAEGAYRLIGDIEHAKRLIGGVDQPGLQTDLPSFGDDFEPFGQRFRINRLLYALGERRSPSELVPDTSDLRDKRMVLFERDLCTVAHIWAKSWTGQTMDQAVAKLESVPLLERRIGSSLETDWGVNWFPAAARNVGFYSLLIEAVSQHGRYALDGLWSGFKQEWDNPRTAFLWSTEARTKVILAFVRAGFQRSWASGELSELDEVVATYGEASERLEECVNHARAWVEIEEHEKARHFLRRAFEEGFGVGYRKDYQLDNWIAWLGRVNELEPDLASKRILDYAQAIQGLDDSIENRAVHSATADLLGTTFTWSPVRATQLFAWLLDEGLITYQSGLGTLLNAMLECSKPPIIAVAQLLSDGLLPLSSRAEPSLMSLVIRRARESAGEYRALEESRRLVAKIRLWASPSQRPSWLQGLAAGMAQLGLSIQDLGVEPSELTEPDQETNVIGDALKLNDGSVELSRQEVENRINSMDDLSELVESEDDGSYFSWNPVASNLVEQTTQEADLLMLADIFRNKRHSSNILACVAVRLNELGFSNQAWRLGEEALANSEEYGWNWFYGNSRIVALKALSDVDKTKASPMVFQYLIRDLESTFGIIQSVCSSLNDILELICSPTPVLEVWREIEEHTAVLLRSEMAGSPPVIFTDAIAKDTPQKAISELAAALLCHPCLAVAQAAQRSLGRFLLQRTPDVSDVLVDCFNRSEEHQERILIVLDAVASMEPQSASVFQARIEELVNSPNWSIRSMAGEVIKKCGWEIPTTNQGFQPLPPIYQLELRPRPLDIPPNQLRISPREPVPDSIDPRFTVLPFNDQIELIARIANVPEDNLFARVVEIMRDLAPPETWSVQAEKRFESSLLSAGLDLPLLRSRVRVARRAMFHAAAELQDAGYINQGATRTLERRLRTHDSEMIMKGPSCRPPDIAGISSLGFRDSVAEWVEDAEEGLKHANRTPENNSVVVGEITIISKRRDRESPRETRYSVLEPVASSSRPLSADPLRLYRTVTNCTLNAYETLSTSSNFHPLLIRNSAHGYYSPGADWIAFNPVIARNLGWTLATDGMFKWVDSDSLTMVESIWWVDGLIAFTASESSSEQVGEGWLVLASQSALEAIQREFGPLTRHSIVVRQYYRKGELVERSAASSEPV